jgi:hypothetical protein
MIFGGPFVVLRGGQGPCCAAFGRGCGRRGWYRERPAAQPRADAKHGGCDAATARRLVQGVPRDALVDRAPRTKGLAVSGLPSAGAPAGRRDQTGRGRIARVALNLAFPDLGCRPLPPLLPCKRRKRAVRPLVLPLVLRESHSKCLHSE